MEDLASDFQLSTRDVVDRIERLEESGRLRGITDDRGKYIHITEEEFENVAKFIKRKGRVNRGELLTECGRLIRMHPTEKDKERIRAEEKEMLLRVEGEFKVEED